MTISEDNKLALSMGVLCFQGFGIRLFEGIIDGAIVLWLIVLTIMNWRYVRTVPHAYWFKIGLVVIGYFLFSMIKGVSILPYLIVAWVSAAVVLTPYYLRQADFVNVMRRFTRFCMYYCLCHIPIMLFLKGALITTSFGMNPKTFLYLFYFNGGEGFAGFPRIQGFCWEPSCWNLLLDLNLVFALYFKEKKSIIIASIISAAAVISNHPWVGIDMENLTNNPLVFAAREDAWTSQGDYEGYMEQGMVNSFAALVVEWGIPITLLIFVLMFKTPLIENKQLRFLYLIAILCVLMGTPIARTGFFYMYALSSMLLYKKENYEI